MFNIGSGELLIILIVALVLIGPKQLPQAARQIGRGVRVLTKLSNTFRKEIQKLSDEVVEKEAREQGKASTQDKDSKPKGETEDTQLKE